VFQIDHQHDNNDVDNQNCDYVLAVLSLNDLVDEMVLKTKLQQI
jgi:hypothetical protein